jgi:hypothetical protein
VPVEGLPTLLESEAVPKRLGLLSIDAAGEHPQRTIEISYRPHGIILEAYMPAIPRSTPSPSYPALARNHAMGAVTYSTFF